MDKINMIGPISCLANRIREYEEEKDYINFGSDRYVFLENVIQNYNIAIDILKEDNRQ